jgi:hypothetical protein
MRDITVAVSDESYRQARIWTAKNDTSVSVVQEPLLSPGSRRNVPTLPPAHPRALTPK